MTVLIIWIIGILGGLSTFLGLYLWHVQNQVRKARLSELTAQTKEKFEKDAQTLANAKLLTATAEADYEKAKLDLPANDIPPAKGKLP